MAGAQIERRPEKVADAPALKIGGKLKGFGPEEEKSSRKAEVKETEALRQMKDAWKTCGYESRHVRDNYSSIIHAIKNLHYTAKDVEEFSIALAEFHYEEEFPLKAGLFLSALINNGKESDYIIHTYSLARPLMHIGFRNEKNITVNGDTGDFVGMDMNGGNITVGGNAGESIGVRMKNGSITVNGDAGEDIGYNMEGGSITVGGNAGDRVGYEMQGGVITVNGNAGKKVGCLMRGGRITVKGDAGDYVGHSMKDGIIIIIGNAGNYFGYCMDGGKIRLEGDYGGLSKSARGRIYHREKLIHSSEQYGL
jgi:formylmethanofuran dehydrogenase subunit C